MSDLRYIYILADDDYLAAEAWHALTGDGLVPYCPNVIKLLGLHLPVDDPWEVNRAWLDKCDAVLRIGDCWDEDVLEHAHSKRIPVVDDINDLSTRTVLRVHAT